MKHLIFLSTVYPTPWQPHKGPANARLVAALRRLGYTVSVVAPVPWPVWRPKPHPTIPEGTEFPIYWYIPGMSRHTLHHTMQWSVKNALERATVSQGIPSAILAFWTHPDGTVALQYGKAHRLPVGIIAAGSDIMLLPSDPKRRQVIIDTVREADHIFAVGNEIARRVVEMGVLPERVSSFVQGVDLRHFGPADRLGARVRLGLPNKGPLLLWVGNMVEVKAPHRVISVMRQLAGQFPAIQLAMIGAGPEESSLKRMAASSGELSPRIHFPGSLGAEALATWYQAADVFVLPSRSEGVPNVLLEAMATGLPFVASHVGSISDLLPFGESITTPEGDIDALASALASILNNATSKSTIPERRDIMDGARHLLQHLNLDTLS